MKKKTLIWIFGVCVLIGALGAVMMLRPVKVSAPVRLEITPSDDYKAVVNKMNELKIRRCPVVFWTLSTLRHYPQHIKSGSYVIESGGNTVKLFQKLYVGNEDAIKLTLGKYRTVERLCEFVDAKMYMPKDTLLKALRDPKFTKQFGCTPETILSLFIPNTYEIYWDATPEQFVGRMQKEYNLFWNEERLKKAAAIDLTPLEVMTLASIVEEETNKNDEKAMVASVYLNRLRIGMLLQADPTVKYAVGDFMLKRILNVHLQVDSPYNTYKYAGLPPAPICTPSISSIDAVLQNQQTDYLYFCARPEFDGYHNFATNLSQHNRNAAKYHRALSQFEK